MGGRGSNFRYNKNSGEINTQKIKFKPLLDDEIDSISEINNDYIDILQEKNHVICYSTDNYNHSIINPNLQKINDIIKKFPGITNNLKNSELKIRGATFEDNQTQACFSYNITDKDDMTIFLGKNVYTEDKKAVEQRAKLNQNSKWWSSSDDDELINKVIAHEYGHFVQKLIIDKKIKNNPNSKDMEVYQLINYANYEAAACKRDILKIQKERFNSTNNFISTYGSDNSREFFAEVFANLVTSKEPTTLAKSLEIYIKENL